MGVANGRVLSLKACSLGVTLALAASFLAIGVGGPSISSVYVVNSASMEPTVAVGDALVVESRPSGGSGRRAPPPLLLPPPSLPPPPCQAFLPRRPGRRLPHPSRRPPRQAMVTVGRPRCPPPKGPRVGEVVLFHPPTALRQRAAADVTVLHTKNAFVKWLVAVAGDRVDVRAGVVSVNGVRVGEVGACRLDGGRGAPAAAAAAAVSASVARQPASVVAESAYEVAAAEAAAVADPSASAAMTTAGPPPAGRSRRGSGGGGSGDGGAPPPDAHMAVSAGQLYVLGDNAPHSCDSRYWGLLPVADVVGPPAAWMWPPRPAHPRRGADARAAKPRQPTALQHAFSSLAHQPLSHPFSGLTNTYLKPWALDWHPVLTWIRYEYEDQRTRH